MGGLFSFDLQCSGSVWLLSPCCCLFAALWLWISIQLMPIVPCSLHGLPTVTNLRCAPGIANGALHHHLQRSMFKSKPTSKTTRLARKVTSVSTQNAAKS